ncbi:hypothetical protein [Hydrogenimonas sp.]
MNEKLSHWLNGYCAGSIKAAAYWLCVSEDQFIEHLGYETLDEEISKKLDWLFETIAPSKIEVEALHEVIEDQEKKLSIASSAANDFLESINQNHYKGKTE